MIDNELTWAQIVAAFAVTLGRAPALDELVELSRTYRLNEAEMAAQAQSFVRAEVAFGSDADEASYRAAVVSGDADKIAALDQLSQERLNALNGRRE